MTRRVAIVYDSFFPRETGGGERVYRAVADEFVRRGWEVDYLTRSGDPGPADFRVVELWQGELYDGDGVRRTSGALAFARAVHRELRRTRGRYDLVIASALPVTTALAARLALGSTPTLVADWLEVWPARKWRAYAGALSGTIAAVLQWLAARSMRHHTVNSTFTGSRLRDAGARGDIIVWGLVDLAGPPRGVREAADPPYLVSVGRLIPDKRMDAIPSALAELRVRYPGLRLVIVGDGPERGRIAETAAREGVADAVELTGRIPQESLDAAIAAAAALVSASAREGFGLTVAEAAAFGVPVVVVDGPDNAAAQLVERGVNGERAASTAPRDLAAAIAQVLAAGEAMRTSSSQWYAVNARKRGLSASLDRLVAALDAPSRGWR